MLVPTIPVPAWTTSAEVGPLAVLFALFCAKHVLADFIFQTQWMVRGKERRTDWLVPLLAHSLVHGAGTFAIVVATVPRLWALAPLDFAVHFVIDRVKGVINQRFDLNPDDRGFWLLLGVDQTLHHLTSFFFVLLIAVNR